MDFISGIILFLIGFAVGSLIVWFVRQKELDSTRLGEDGLKEIFGSISRQALDQNIETFLKMAESKFGELLKSSDGQLDEKKKLIDQSIKEMKNHLEGLGKQTSELKGQMEASRKGITELSDTTSQLRQILSSSQARGQWGERMVEDILSFIGLVDGVNYTKQTQEGKGRPDFTFYLPKDRHINMDVKFPLTHYENFLAADNENDQISEKKAFLSDVRNHVKEIAKRNYINPEAGTVDYIKGEINLTTINITSTVKSNNVIEVQAFPDSNDIIGLKDLYLKFSISDSTINMVKDTISSGDQISGVGYKVTSSYTNGDLIRA